MRKPVILLLLFFVSTTIAYSQVGLIKGTVTDTSEKKNLSNAVITLLKPADSVLIKFTRTDGKGNFLMPNINPGKYVILVSFPKYVDYADEIELKEAATLDLGKVFLTPKSVLLANVILHTVGAIRIKGDTTEYIADSFKVKEGANVEDLLKKLPGLQVNSKGEITAQGKKVDKVLVDGEEFFGDDPTMATQNLAAKTVDKVQVYDTKTEQDQLKGIGGNSDSKTLNIKLKDNAKKGYFGRIEAGSNFDQLHNAKLLFNRFEGKKKVSVYGSKRNTSTGSLGWEDKNKLGIENDFEYDEIGGYYYSFGTSDDFSDWRLQGLPNGYAAGGLYSNKWQEDKNNLNLSYNYNRLGTTNIGSTLKQTLLQDTTFYNNENTNSNALKQQHVINGKYEWKLDTLTSFKFSTVGTYKTTHTYSTTHSEALNEDQQFVNTGDRINDMDATRKQLDNQLTYKQLFSKKGRQLIATLRYSLINDDNSGSLFSDNKFYKNGVQDSFYITDQSKIGNGQSRTLGGKITYNEPIGPNWNLVTEYSYNDNNSTSHRNTFEKNGSGEYKVLTPLFSNNFHLNANSNTGTATMRYISKKWKYAFGGGISAVKLKVNDLDHNSTKDYHFTNFTPQVQFSYAIKAQTNIGFRYNGNTRQPTLEQLQPIRNNNDPLNIYIGNPDLKVGFNHSFNLWYNSFKILSSQYMYMGFNYNIQQKAITTFNTIDSFGKITSMPVNVDGNKNYNFYGGWYSGQGEKKLIHELNASINGGRNVTFINQQRSLNIYANMDFYYGISYSVEEKYKFRIAPKIGRIISSSSLRKDINNNYWTYGGSASGYLMLPGKIEINSDVNFDLRERISAFDQNTNIITWNASINRKVFKKKTGNFIFTANDLLNQNKGFNRIINSNFVTDQRYQRLGQYFMLSFQWTFNKMPGVK